jgi:hypothetical protein
MEQTILASGYKTVTPVDSQTSIHIQEGQTLYTIYAAAKNAISSIAEAFGMENCSASGSIPLEPRGPLYYIFVPSDLKKPSDVFLFLDEKGISCARVDKTPLA